MKKTIGILLLTLSILALIAVSIFYWDDFVDHQRKYIGGPGTPPTCAPKCLTIVMEETPTLVLKWYLIKYDVDIIYWNLNGDVKTYYLSAKNEKDINKIVNELKKKKYIENVIEPQENRFSN